MGTGRRFASGITVLALLSVLAPLVASTPVAAADRRPAPRRATGATGATGASVTTVVLEPGDAVGAIVAAAAPNTRFSFSPGIYRDVEIVPRDGQQFIGDPGAVFDGTNQTARAFAGHAKNVLIKNLTLTRYAAPAQHGAIAADGSRDWTVDDNEISQSAGTGLRVGDGMVVDGNWIHHNHQLGIGGTGRNVVVESNDIAFNNYQSQFDPGWEAGGAKFVTTRHLIVRDNLVHDNVGPGLWSDIGSIDTLYEGNVVHDNDYAGTASSAGIFYEISGSAVIRDNVVVRNGTSWRAWGWNGGIQIAASSDVQIYDNQVIDNANGITLIQQDRYTEWAPGLRNVSVHDNVVRTSGHSGAYEDTGQNIYSSARAIHFSANTYLGPIYEFEWNNNTMDRAAWLATGNDKQATFR